MACPQTDEVSSWCLLSDAIKCSAERPEWPAGGVAGHRPADGFRIGPVLDRQREHNRRIAGVGVCGAVAFLTTQEELPDPSVGKPTNRRGVFQSADLDVEGLGQPAGRELLARAHGAPPCLASARPP